MNLHPRRPRDGLRHDLRQSGGVIDRPSSDNGSSDSSTPPLAAQLIEQVSDPLLVVVIDNVRGG